MADPEPKTDAATTDDVQRRLAAAFEAIEAEGTPEALAAYARLVSGEVENEENAG